MIRKSYVPANSVQGNSLTVGSSTRDEGSDGHFVRALLAGELTMDEVTQGYASHVYQQLGRYDLAASKMGVNWRTVRSKVRQYRKKPL